MKFYICEHCGNIVTKLTDKGVPVHCCGQAMTELKAGVVDAAVEKHVPVVAAEDGAVRVNVGAVSHPMAPEHFIEWVVVETDREALFHRFQPGDAPETVIALAEGQRARAVYAYCNLHGLWMQEL